MLGSKSSERLLANIRNGLPMTQGEKLRLIVSLSIPSMLAQLTTVMMFFIDARCIGKPLFAAWCLVCSSL